VASPACRRGRAKTLDVETFVVREAQDDHPWHGQFAQIEAHAEPGFKQLF